jgi:hypothetical protein
LLSQRPAGRGTGSALEVALKRIIDSSDLPRPVCQYEVLDAGKVVARPDFAYPHALLAIETDGYEFHHGRARWRRDLQRRSALARLGWRVMHFTSEDLGHRDAVVAAIRAALFRTLELSTSQRAVGRDNPSG